MLWEFWEFWLVFGGWFLYLRKFFDIMYMWLGYEILLDMEWEMNGSERFIVLYKGKYEGNFICFS